MPSHTVRSLLLPLLLAPALAAAQPDLAEVARRVVAQTNEFRQAQGVAAVEPDAKLAKAAESFARFMARTDLYSHTADGKSPADRARQQGYEHCLVAENIARLSNVPGQGTEELATRLVRGWAGSPGHRKNMLDAGVAEIGVGLARSAISGRYFAVQMFARPSSKMIEFRLANESPSSVRYEIEGKSFQLQPRVVATHRQCLATRVLLHLPGQAQGTALTPQNGERYTVVRETAQRYRLKME